MQELGIDSEREPSQIFALPMDRKRMAIPLPLTVRLEHTLARFTRFTETEHIRGPRQDFRDV